MTPRIPPCRTRGRTPSGPAVTLTGPATATPSFTAPNVGETRDITLTLTVTDSGSLTGTDTVTITVNDSPNTAPTANAGANQTVAEGDTVSLNGTASDDDPEDSPTYAWTFTTRTALGITLADAAALDTSFAAPNVAADTPVLFTLTVSDDTASSSRYCTRDHPGQHQLAALGRCRRQPERN